MLAQVIFSGLALGTLYGLVALGFALIFKATEVFNFAQGMLMACGAFFAVTAFGQLGLPFPAAIVFIVGCAGVLGVLIHTFLIRPITGRPMLTVIMMTMALSIVLRAALELVYGKQGLVLNTSLPKGMFLLGEVRISQLHLVAAGVSVFCMVAFALFFRLTPIGLQMRATATSHEAALITGVNVHRVNRLAWAIGSALAAIGGVFLGQLQIASVELEHIGLLALPAVVIGGMQSLPGAVVGGLLVGVLEQLTSSYLSPKAGDLVIYVLLLFMLLWRPWGIWGQRELGRV